MSSKKNNKVERIIKRNNVGKNIRSFISGMLVLVVGGVTFLFMALSAFYTGIINSDRDMKKIVAITNENWENQAALDKQIASLMAENASFTQVLYVDDDLEPILMYGERKPVFSDEEAFGKNPAEVLRENGMFREEVVTSFGLIEDTIFAEIKGLFESINGYESKTLFDWSDTDVKMDVKWIVYKTDIENVNVCVYYKYTLNKLQAAQYNFGRFAFMLLVILCFILLFLFNLLMVRRRRLTNKIVYTDSVTGGKNREYFLDIPLKKLKRNAQYAVAQIRFEKYRNYCTAYGLKQGEKLLETIYYCTKEHLHWKEKVAHLEKADFAILLEYKDRQQLEKRLKNMAADFNKAKQGQHFTFSVGINPILSRKDDMADILTAAGIALSKAGKQNAGIVWFNDAMKEEQIWERRVEDDMEKALINHEFQVYLQPKYSTKKEELAAAEALVRWIHPEFDFISPGKFIPIFETNGFILKLDDYMLREISRLQAQWLKEGKKLVPISVNVSRAHFSMDDLAEHICSIVDEYKVPHEYIELELTESAFFDDKETLLSTVKKLKSYGFRISMDDFGAGYSSLNSLKELPLDIIKLDAEFFRSIDDVDRANAIVGDTIALAKKLGMEIVAEGIETRDQVDFLAGQDCDLIQGFYFAKPLPVAEFTKRAWG
ncbi:MAG: EAL domain-containing protein [Treponema sp.]|nr:EAL domain-containing protein [Candidatus Treponema caballi]